MRIALITSGAGGMYCGSCMNANTVAAALIARGHQVALLPTYTPMRIDEAPVARERVFFGAINVYLQQRWRLFRHTPRLLDRLLDQPWLLHRLVSWSYEVDNAEIGALTLSMLEGEGGHQAKELEKLVAWLRDDFAPDVVHLSFAFFLGFARRIKETLGVPVVCSVQGEEIMLDQLPERYRQRILAQMRRRVAEVDAVVAPCHAYAEFMRGVLEQPAERLHVAELGIAADDYLALEPRAENADTSPGPTIGFLARICPEKGLHVLLEAFRLLAAEMPDARLRAAGFISAHDRPYRAGLEASIADAGLSERVEIVGEVDRGEKLRFLASLDLFTVPTVYREPKGLFLLEAMASGIPVVAPRHGSFPELLAAGGGELIEPENPRALADALLRLAKDDARCRAHARAGRSAVRARFTADAEAARYESLYQRLVAAGAARVG